MTSRALVLGGGGVTGVAWEIGLLAGLAEVGVDLSGELPGADLVIGTSAGSVVATMVAAGVDLEKMYAAQLAGSSSEIAAKIGVGVLLRWVWANVGRRDAQRARARIGAMALAASTVSEADRRAVIEQRLPVHEWPARRLLVTAVDARSGEFVVFDRDSGVSLVDAVGASCAVPGVWPPVTIGDRRYIDGGVRAGANVDLAAGCDRVVVVAPITRGGGTVPSVAKQAAELDARVAVVAPDAPARRAIGRNVLDPSRRADAARGGRAQAARVAPTVADAWGGD